MSDELKPGECWLEIVRGAEGPSIYIADDSGGYRLAGPKPWGGGSVQQRFRVKLNELVREANMLLADSARAAEAQSEPFNPLDHEQTK